MKAAQLTGPGRFEVRDVPDPQPGPGQLLLQVEAAGMCGSDVHLVDHPPSALPLPLTLGHETAARVLDAQGAPGIEEGQLVLVAGIWGCMSCRPCRTGRVNACETWARQLPLPLGPGLGFPGGMAEYMVAPQTAVVGIGDLDPVIAAPLADAGLTPAHAISLVRDRLGPDSTVLVIGVGGLGHMALQILRATTATRIIAADTDPKRVEAATGYGADIAFASDHELAAKVLEATGGVGAHVVFDLVGVDATLATAIGSVRTYGSIVMVGLGGGTLPMGTRGTPRKDAPPWGVTVVRPYGATAADMLDVVALAQRGLLKASVERHPLFDAPVVLDRLRRGEVSGRAVLLP